MRHRLVASGQDSKAARSLARKCAPPLPLPLRGGRGDTLPGTRTPTGPGSTAPPPCVGGRPASVAVGVSRISAAPSPPGGTRLSGIPPPPREGCVMHISRDRMNPRKIDRTTDDPGRQFGVPLPNRKLNVHHASRGRGGRATRSVPTGPAATDDQLPRGPAPRLRGTPPWLPPPDPTGRPPHLYHSESIVHRTVHAGDLASPA